MTRGLVRPAVHFVPLVRSAGLDPHLNRSQKYESPVPNECCDRLRGLDWRLSFCVFRLLAHTGAGIGRRLLRSRIALAATRLDDSPYPQRRARAAFMPIEVFQCNRPLLRQYRRLPTPTCVRWRWKQPVEYTPRRPFG